VALVCPNGLNKDEPGRPNYDAARALATQASIDFVNQILDDPSVTGNTKAIKALLGLNNSTLGMVIDTTGSMGDIIGQVKAQVTSIVNSVVGTDNEPDQYLLEPFNDPFTGPVTATADASTFLGQVNGLFASGGGDCPELAMQGLLEAINKADDNATLFLFTDASAKDSALAGTVAQAAVAKKVQINFALFGSCSPIDPGFLNVASQTGGQLLFLQRPEAGNVFPLVAPQLGAHPFTIALSRGVLAGTEREFLVPVDSKLAAVIFSVGIDSKTAVNVVRPSGALVLPTDADAQITDLSSGRLLTLNSPQPGTYRVQVSGSGTFSVLAEGRGASGFAPILFDSFQFVALAGRPAHEGFFPIPGQPLLGSAQKGRARLVGPFSSAAFSVVSESGDLLQNISLTANQPDAAATDLLGDFTLPSQQFRIAVNGLDASGNQYQRVFNPLFAGSTVLVTVANTTDTLTAGATTAVAFSVQNLGPSGTFSLVASDGLHAVTAINPTTLTLNSGQSATFQVSMTPPRSTPDGSSDTLSVKITSTTDPAATNGTVQTFTVVANRPPDTSGARPSVSALWPPNQKMVPVFILGVTDPDGDPVTITVTAITQNEPTNGLGSGDACPDATGVGSSSITLRAERDGGAKGRLYTIFFTATDGRGGSSQGSVSVVVPHDEGTPPSPAAGSFDSTTCPL